MIDTALLHAQCAHAVKLMLEAILTAGFLTFVWMVAPYIRRPR